jgi:predicted dinucleotide-binding enzyme
MRFAIMGTGQVGQAIAKKLNALGHDVVLGSRDPAQKRELGLPVARHAEAARHGEWIVNALPGEQAIDILGGCDISGKILIDIGNYDQAVDRPIITPLGQALQSAFPDMRLVKTLNSVSAHLMVDPEALGEAHSVFIASNDSEAKAEVTSLLRTFGWQDIIDLGDLDACRAMEQLIPLWMALERLYKGPHFNLKVVRD